MGSNKNPNLRRFGTAAIVFSLLYVVVYTWAFLSGANTLPGAESGQQMTVMLFCYLIVVFFIICGGACLLGQGKMAAILALITTIIAIIAFAYAFIAANTISVFEFVAIVLGTAIYVRARR